MPDSEFKFNVDLLREYGAAALQNASELLAEANLLFSNGHNARAYFLAVASIEETGKALQAFDAQGRNLRDSAVTTKLRRAMEDHSQKITMGFSAMLQASPDIRKTILPMTELMVHLKRGREPSMYTDIRYETSEVKTPSVLVKDIAARDCVRLASDCLAHAKKHIAEKKPLRRTRSEDELFSMKSDQFQNLAKTEGFWWFWLAQHESGKTDFAAAAVTYQRDFVSKGKIFERPENMKSGS